MPKKKTSDIRGKKSAIKKPGLPKSAKVKQTTRPRKKSTDQKNDLKRSADIFSIVFKMNPNATAVSTVEEGKFIQVNRAFLEFTGYSEKEIITHTARELRIWAVPEERDFVVGQLRDVGYIHNYEVNMRTKSGSVRNCLFSADFITMNSERYMLSMAVDITERKRAEEEIKRSQDAYKNVVENSPIGIFRTCPPGKFTMVNPAMARMFGYDTVEEFRKRVNNEAAPIYYNIEDQKHFLYLIQTYKRFNNVEFKCRNRDGDPFWVMASCRASSDEKGRITAIEGFFIDISDRKRAEEDLKNSREHLLTMLKDKELLLREIHHRVKNNMQIISSLLGLQAMHVKDGRDRDLFVVSQNRVKSMALVHEKLYRSESFVGLDFQEYISDLIHELFSTYYHVENVAVRINAGTVTVAIDDLVPCSLIIYELVSNALKHAFPGDRKGTVTVDFFNEGEEKVLRISDDGIGLPDGLDVKNTFSLGLQLVNALASQLKGTMHFNGGSGTVFTVRFRGQS